MPAKPLLPIMIAALRRGGLSLLLLLVSGIGAHAQINFVFMPDTQTAAPGVTVTYSATVTNTGTGTVFLNNDSFTFTGPGSLDDTLFGSNFETSLGAGQAITNKPIFTIGANPSATPGDYLGTFNIFGGNNNSANTLLGTQNFHLVVTTAAVPESSSLVLLVLGLGGIACACRLRPATSA